MLITETSEKTGTVFVDAIKSKIYPDKVALLEMLERFESGEYNSDDLSDLSDALTHNMVDFYRLILPVSKECHVRIIYYDDHKLDLKEYRNTLDWDVVELLDFVNSHTKPLVKSDIPFIRDFLNTPPGKEEEALKAWQDYWSKVDFKKRVEELRKSLRAT